MLHKSLLGLRRPAVLHQQSLRMFSKAFPTATGSEDFTSDLKLSKEQQDSIDFEKSPAI